MNTHFPTRFALLLGVGTVISFALLLLGICVGSTGFDAIWLYPINSEQWQIIMDIRLPRSIAAWQAGALLGLSGAIAQGLFRNPLADPFLLGSASGASLGVALALTLLGTSSDTVTWLTQLGISGTAFLGALAGVGLTLFLAQGVAHNIRLLLAGVVVGYVLGALKELLSMSAPSILPAMQAFNTGTTAFVDWSGNLVMFSILLICILLAVACAKVLDALVLGEFTAKSLGLPINPVRALLVAILAAATGTAVAHTGLIAFVGLAAPHLVRSMINTQHRHSLVLSSAMGAVLLLSADILARYIISPAELPIGVVTALIGGGYLLYLMRRQPTQYT